MDTEKFWSMIDEARQQSGGDPASEVQMLTDALSLLSEQDIQEFEHILFTMTEQAYRADLLGAIELVTCGCGDDGFDDFRQWLIAQGQMIFEKVLENPENLADFVDRSQRFDLCENFMAGGFMTDAAMNAYRRKTGQEMPEVGYGEPLVLVETSFIPDDELPTKFPRLWAKFGDCSDEEQFDD